MTTIQPGEFWIAEIFFTSGISAKKRPVLILWIDDQDAVAAVITSAPPRSQMDIFLDDWSSSGLRVASTVRLSRLDCLEKSLFIAKIGQISNSDAVKVKEAWQKYIKPHF
jgi:mRNA interferase MazF